MTGTILGVRHARPAFSMPTDACDCHVHVFGPAGRFPMSPSRAYTPGPATAADLLAHQQALGLDRVVVVQPSVYGIDNRCMLDAIARLGGSRARGVAVVDPNTPRPHLEQLDRAGVRGIRLNLVAAGIAGLTEAREQVARAGDLAASMGWHVQIFAELATVAALGADLEACAAPLVVDHFGRASARLGIGQPGFDVLLSLVGSGKVWAKLSAPYLVSELDDHGDVAPLVRALIAAEPNRLLWGSDWPHPGGGFGLPAPDGIAPFRGSDDGAALNRLAQWVDDPALLELILSRNPARLYGFEGAETGN